MITLVYASDAVGPICKKIASQYPDKIKVVQDTQLRGPVKGTLVRWGSRTTANADTTFNSAEAINIARDKAESRRQLGELSPPTWFRLNDIRFPCVIRPRRHCKGQRFFVCKTPREAEKAVLRCRRGWYATKLVDKAAEYRVFVLQDHVVAVSERFPGKPGDIAWNLALGGRMTNVRYKEWKTAPIVAALKAARKVGLDWGAIDVAIDKDGRAVVFELNTAPGLRNPFTIKQIATALVNSGTVPTNKHKFEEGTTWKKLLHPALRPSQ